MQIEAFYSEAQSEFVEYQRRSRFDRLDRGADVRITVGRNEQTAND